MEAQDLQYYLDRKALADELYAKLEALEDTCPETLSG